MSRYDTNRFKIDPCDKCKQVPLRKVYSICKTVVSCVAIKNTYDESGTNPVKRAKFKVINPL